MWPFKLKLIKTKHNFHFLSHASHVSSAPRPHVVSGYPMGPHGEATSILAGRSAGRRPHPDRLLCRPRRGPFLFTVQVSAQMFPPGRGPPPWSHSRAPHPASGRPCLSPLRSPLVSHGPSHPRPSFIPLLAARLPLLEQKPVMAGSLALVTLASPLSKTCLYTNSNFLAA